MAQMSNSDKYRVQTRYANPQVIALQTGKAYRWVDSSAHHILSAAKSVRAEGQRVIKICAPSEGALLQDTQAYRGRRFNIVIAPEVN